MAVRLKKYSFRFSEELFNSRLAQKAEIEQMQKWLKVHNKITQKKCGELTALF